MKNVGLAVILLFCGCLTKDDPLTTLQGFNPCRVAVPAASTQSLIHSPGTVDLDTLLPSGWRVDFRAYPDHWYAVSWSAPDNTIIGKFKSEGCMSGDCPYSFQCEFENYIALNQSCGLALWALRLLPKNKSDTTISIICDLAIDTKRGYILSKGCNHKDVSDSCDFCLLNINTMKHHPIFLKGLPETGFFSSQLDKIEFEDNGVHLWWNATDDYRIGTGMTDTVIAF